MTIETIEYKRLGGLGYQLTEDSHQNTFGRTFIIATVAR
jgi:hypothetical protein